MKKFLIGLAVVVLVGFGALQIAESVIMGGDSYYVQITTDGEKRLLKMTTVMSLPNTTMNCLDMTKMGKAKPLISMASKSVLCVKAYLKLTWNEKKA